MSLYNFVEVFVEVLIWQITAKYTAFVFSSLISKLLISLFLYSRIQLALASFCSQSKVFYKVA